MNYVLRSDRSKAEIWSKLNLYGSRVDTPLERSIRRLAPSFLPAALRRLRRRTEFPKQLFLYDVSTALASDKYAPVPRQ